MGSYIMSYSRLCYTVKLSLDNAGSTCAYYSQRFYIFIFVMLEILYWVWESVGLGAYVAIVDSLWKLRNVAKEIV